MIRTITFLILAFTNLHAQTSTVVSKKFLSLGDSYTIGESVPEKERWPEQLTEILRAKGEKIENPRIIAVTGWRTDQLRKAIEEAQLKNEYDLVSLLIGVNNQYQNKLVEGYALEFEELLLMAVGLAKGKKGECLCCFYPGLWIHAFWQIKAS